MNRRGFSLITIVMAGVLVGGAMLLYASSVTSSRKAVTRAEQKLIAKAHATELLEFFRSLSRSQLNTYLSRNPVSGSTAAADVYPLCAHRNIIDRASSTTAPTILNPDPIADLEPSPLDGPEPRTRVNRFYQVQVVNSASLLPVAPPCTGKAPANFAANSGESFFVTVGVTWVLPGESYTAPEREVVSAFLMPE